MADRQIVTIDNYKQGWTEDSSDGKSFKSLENIVVDEKNNYVVRNGFSTLKNNEGTLVGKQVKRIYNDVLNEDVSLLFKNDQVFKGERVFDSNEITNDFETNPVIVCCNGITNDESENITLLKGTFKTNIEKSKIIKSNYVNYLNNYNDEEQVPYKILNGVTKKYTLGVVEQYFNQITSSRAIAMACHNQYIIVVCLFGGIYRSTDNGVSWSSISNPTADHLYDVVYINGVFIACGTNGRIIRSTDNGASWSIPTTAYSNNFHSICATPSKIAIVGNSTQVVISEDNGVSWYSYTINTSLGNAYDIVKSKKYFWVIDYNGYVYKSVDLVTWVLDNAGLSGHLENISSDEDGNLVIQATDGTNSFIFYKTEEGSTWGKSGCLFKYIRGYQGNDLKFFEGQFVLCLREASGTSFTGVFISPDKGRSWFLKFYREGYFGSPYFSARGCFFNESIGYRRMFVVSENSTRSLIFYQNLNESYDIDYTHALSLGINNKFIQNISIYTDNIGTTYNYGVALVLKRQYTYNGKTYIDRSEPIYHSLGTSVALGSSNPLILGTFEAILRETFRYFNYKNDLFSIELYRTINNGTTYYKDLEFASVSNNNPNRTIDRSHTDDNTLQNYVGQGVLYTHSSNSATTLDILPNIQPPACKYIAYNEGIVYYAHVTTDITNNEVINRKNRVYLSHKDSEATYYTFFVDFDDDIDDIKVIYGKVYVSSGLKWYLLSGYYESNGSGFINKTVVTNNYGSVDGSLSVVGSKFLYYKGSDGFYAFNGTSLPVRLNIFNKLFNILDIRDCCFLREQQLVIWSIQINQKNPYLPVNFSFLLVYNEVSGIFTYWHGSHETGSFDGATIFDNFISYPNYIATTDKGLCLFDNINEIENNILSSFFLGSLDFETSAPADDYTYPKMYSFNSSAVNYDEQVIYTDKDNIGLETPEQYNQYIPVKIITPDIFYDNNKIVPCRIFIDGIVSNDSNTEYTTRGFTPFIIKNNDGIQRNMGTYLFLRNGLYDSKTLEDEYTKSISDFRYFNVQRLAPDSVSRCVKFNIGVKNCLSVKYTNISSQVLDRENPAVVKYYPVETLRVVTTLDQVIILTNIVFSLPSYSLFVCLYTLDSITGLYTPITVTTKNNKTVRMRPVQILNQTGSLLTINDYYTLPDATYSEGDIFMEIYELVPMDNILIKRIKSSIIPYGLNFESGNQEKN